MQHAVRISDGLGNQMFQYAFAYALSQKSNAKVVLDPLFWGTSLRKYQLEEFHIALTRKMVSPFWDYLLGFGLRNGRRFKERYRQHSIRKNYQLYTEKQIMHYDASVWNQTQPTFFMGFWQTPRYFEDYYEDLRMQFTMKRPLSVQAGHYMDQIKQGISVALHIRRTDYVRKEGNATLQFRFYEEALNRLKKELGDFQLFVFTDDKEFVKENFHLHNYILIENVSDLEEFELMKGCAHHIVANSTFSWWAAYLGENKGGIVYAPCTGIWSEEFYPKEWNLIYTDTEEYEKIGG